jgi:hypothetical protein
MSLVDKESMLGPKSKPGQPGIGVSKPGTGKANSPDTLASEAEGGLYKLAVKSSTSLYDRDGKITKYHP